MAFSAGIIVNGYKFTMQFHGEPDEDGLVIPSSAVFDDDYIDALKGAKKYFDQYYVYVDLFHNWGYRETVKYSSQENNRYYIDLAERALADTSMLIPWTSEQINTFKDMINVYTSELKPTPKKEKVKHQGYVYIIEGAGKQYKIGKSKTPKKRIKRLGVNLPFPIDVIHLIPSNDYDNAEYYLHTKFSHLRGRGEWFNLEDTHIDFIKTIERLDTKDMQS